MLGRKVERGTPASPFRRELGLFRMRAPPQRRADPATRCALTVTENRSMSRRLSLGLLLSLALASTPLPQATAIAQDAPNAGSKLKEPLAHRVFQRDRNNRADIPLVLDEES